MSQDIPKALVEVNGKSLLQRQIEYIKPYVDNIVLATGYKSDMIKERFKDCIISEEIEPLGTGGAIRNAMKYIKNGTFLVINVDDLANVNLNKLKRATKPTIVLGRFRSPFGIVRTRGDEILRFEEKPLMRGWCSIGWYLLTREMTGLLPEKGSLEKEVFPKIKLKCLKHKGYWFPVNDEKQKQEAEEFI